MTNKKTYDVIILGSGIAGTVLGAILAKHGLSVALLDGESHPRMAIGESTIPLTSALLRTLADRYGIPELRYLTSFREIERAVSGSNGIKSNFGFVLHHEGEPVNPAETNQVVIPALLDIEHHLFRQDVDNYMLTTAIKYGAESFQKVQVTDVEAHGDGVTLTTSAGTFRGRYLSDASGHGSPVARKYGLRENPPRNKHHSRGLFTHMVGVKPFDEILKPRAANQPRSWHEGTLHHLFDGGWMWVIPFNNHVHAHNKLVSVGFLLDPRRHPKWDGDPEEEFRAIIARFPDMQAQFENARTVRPWVSSGRIQYSSTKLFLDRIGLTSHAAGFVDALYSQGLPITMATINLTAQKLIDACREDSFGPERFADVEAVAQAMIDRHDGLVYSSFVGFRDFDLWNATVRVWALGIFLSTFWVESTLGMYRKSRNSAVFDRLEQGPNFGGPIPGNTTYDRIVSEMVADCQKVEVGDMDPKEAARRVFSNLQSCDIVPPAFGFDDPLVRFFNPTPLRMAKTMIWSKLRADREVGMVMRQALRGFVKRKVFKVG